jgi:hypothetical protein
MQIIEKMLYESDEKPEKKKGDRRKPIFEKGPSNSEVPILNSCKG